MEQDEERAAQLNAAQAALSNDLRKREDRGPFEITALQLATAVGADHAEAEKTLEALAAQGELQKFSQFVCPCERAERLESGTDAVCPACGLAFGTDLPGYPKEVAFYRYDAPRTRDVRWMVTLHGMNTVGAWQEEFMWRVSRTYGYSVPVAIYKYGDVKSGAILKFRQRALVKILIAKMHALSGDAEGSGFPGPADVIAHSLGAWLLGHALVADNTLRVGRVILVGSILRPDFQWRELIDRGQVQAVLCHYSAKDFWARISHYVIPDSGPSGRIGFNDRKSVINHVAADLAHSDYFLPAQMPGHFAALWTPFLTFAAQRIGELSDGTESPQWKESAWILRATALRVLLLAATGMLVAFAALALLVGIPTLLTQ